MRILLLGVVSFVRVSCWGGWVCWCAVRESNEDSSSRCGVSYGRVLCGCVGVGCVVIDGFSFFLMSLTCGCVRVCVYVPQPIADRMAQHLEIISKNSRFSSRRTRVLMGLIIYYLALIVNPMGRILVC